MKGIFSRKLCINNWNLSVHFFWVWLVKNKITEHNEWHVPAKVFFYAMPRTTFGVEVAGEEGCSVLRG